MTVSENELLDALAASGPTPAPPHAMTAAQLRDALGLTRTTLRKRLKQLQDEGRLEIWRTTQPDVSGRPQGVPAYTIKPAPKKRR